MEKTPPPEHPVEDASTTEGLPVAPGMGAALASVQAPRESVAVGPRVILIAAIAIGIGIGAALVAVFLTRLIGLVTNAAYYGRLSTEFSAPSIARLGAWSVLVPVAGAIIVGIMARYGSAAIRGHGIPEVMERVLYGKSRISPRVMFLKPLSAAIAIGTGGPFGAEGPIIMTGGAFGSIFAQLFHLSAAERKTLLVAGAAGGMAAVFAAPVAAVLLGVELLLFEWKPRSFIPVAVASIAAAIMRVPLLGAGPIFPVVPHASLGMAGLGSALVVGLITGIASGLVTTLVYTFEDLFKRLPIHWMWWPAIGAVFVGIGGVIDPRVLGVGYDTIHAMMRSDLVGTTLIALLIAKSLVWAVALGSGTSGGVLAPLLIIGGALGSLLGHWMPVGDPGLWAMVGMAAMMGGTMQAPLTGMIFVLELSHDLNALPALLVGSVAALGVTVLWLRRSILTEKLARRGQHIAREYSVDLLELTRVADVMDKDVPIVPAETTVLELSNRIAQNDPKIAVRQATLIVDHEQKLIGIITRGDILRSLRESMTGTMTVLEAGESKLVVAYEDESLHDAAVRMLKHDIGRLPVVDRQDPRRVIGYLGRSAILTAQARFYEEEEVRGRGLSLPPMLQRTLAGFGGHKLAKKNGANARPNESGV